MVEPLTNVNKVFSKFFLSTIYSNFMWKLIKTIMQNCIKCWFKMFEIYFQDHWFNWAKSVNYGVIQMSTLLVNETYENIYLFLLILKINLLQGYTNTVHALTDPIVERVIGECKSKSNDLKINSSSILSNDHILVFNIQPQQRVHYLPCTNIHFEFTS